MTASGRSGAIALPKSRKARALLAILALASPRAVLREQVTSLLWSRREREQARASLRQCLRELHEMEAAMGGSWLRSFKQTLQLEASQVWVDVQAIAAATVAEAGLLDLLPTGGSDEFLLEDLGGLDPAFDEWITVEGRRIRGSAAILAGLVMDQQTEPGATMAAARRMVAIAPAHEVGWQRLIEACIAAGDPDAAVEAYEQCAQALATASGGMARPSGETSALITRLREMDGGHRQIPAPDRGPAAGRGRDPDPSGLRDVWLGVAIFRATDPRDQASFSVGLAEEITMALSRLNWINLIAPGSIAAMARESTEETERWHRLGLDFLLDGTIQRNAEPDAAGDGPGGRIRVTARLLDIRGASDLSGGEVVWSARFDRAAADLFALQDEIAAETAAQMEPQLILHEYRRVAARPTADASAYELLMRAVPAMYRLTQPGFAEAGLLLARAADRAPDNSTIFSWWACWYAFLVGQGWAVDAAAAMERAGELADQAVALDPSCARALSVAGYVRCFLLHKDIEETIGLHDRALALNPNLPFGWAVSALTLAYSGEHVAAVARGQRAKLLSPFDPHSFFFDSVLMVPHLMLRDYETVAVLGRRSLALNPSMSSTYKGLLSAVGHLGRRGEAEEILGKLRRLEPGFTLSDAAARSPLRRVEDLHIYIDGLRKAGLPEEW